MERAYYRSSMNITGRKEIRGKGTISKSMSLWGRKDRPPIVSEREQIFELGQLFPGMDYAGNKAILSSGKAVFTSFPGRTVLSIQ